jgi:hypothetical protein
MALIDYYRKYLYGQAPQDLGISGGQRLQEGTTGLLGGQQGATGGLLGGLSNINPNLLIGASIAGAGLQGKDPFSSVVPAVAQAAQIQNLITPKLGSLKHLMILQQNLLFMQLIRK